MLAAMSRIVSVPWSAASTCRRSRKATTMATAETSSTASRVPFSKPWKAIPLTLPSCTSSGSWPIRPPRTPSLGRWSRLDPARAVSRRFGWRWQKSAKRGLASARPTTDRDRLAGVAVRLGRPPRRVVGRRRAVAHLDAEAVGLDDHVQLDRRVEPRPGQVRDGYRARLGDGHLEVLDALLVHARLARDHADDQPHRP